MHFHFPFTPVQILWTLTLAAHLVLLVVLLGRDRTRRFFWFTSSIALVTLRLIASRLLYGRLPQITLGGIFVILADLSAIVSFLVLVEIARRVFRRAGRTARLIWILILFAIGVVVVATWGHWPAWKTIAPHTLLAWLSLLQLFAQKSSLLVDVLTVLLGVLVVAFGRRYGAGWRTHAQRIMIGLSTASLAQILVQVIWQLIALSAKPHSRQEYDRILGIRENLFNANSVVYFLVAIWWIACLWIDEPGTGAELAEVGVPVNSGKPDRKASAKAEPPKPDEERD
ncbi:MAG: hypothetical protein WCC26_06400 [Terracidiphilus sp.]